MNVGHGNVVVAEQIVAIVALDSLPVKRLIESAKGSTKLIDATNGRRTRAVIVTGSDHLILSSLDLPRFPSGWERTAVRGVMPRLSIKRRGTLFVVSAPSGAGKTTLCREIRLRLHDIAYSVSVTTRPPRPGEMDGTDFRFVSEPEFRAMLDRGELAEWATVHGNLYGTPAKPLETALADGHDILLDIDTQGAASSHALPRGGAGLHRGALDGRARAAPARARSTAERDRAATGPRAPRGGPVAAVVIT